MDRRLPVALPTASPLQPLIDISSLVRVLSAKKASFMQTVWFNLNFVVNLWVPVVVFRILVEGVEEMSDNVQGFIHVNTCNKISFMLFSHKTLGGICTSFTSKTFPRFEWILAPKLQF